MNAYEERVQARKERYEELAASKAHYIHVDLINRDGTRKGLFITKCFGGWDISLQISNLAAKLFSW